MVEILLPAVDQENKSRIIQWAADNFNGFKLLFNEPLELDYEALAEFAAPVLGQEPHEPHPFAAQDAEPTKKHLPPNIRSIRRDGTR